MMRRRLWRRIAGRRGQRSPDRRIFIGPRTADIQAGKRGSSDTRRTKTKTPQREAEAFSK